ncbi:MAG: hypothetical protein RLZZ381_4064, partial [Cyanobacteriota bacterium]
SQTIVTASWDETIRVWSLEGTLLKTINIDKKRIWDLDVSPDGNRSFPPVKNEPTVPWWCMFRIWLS